MRKRNIIFIVMVLCLILSGCGQTGDTVSTAEEPSESIDYVALYKSMPVNELFTMEWKRSDIKDAEHFMSFTDYIPNVFQYDLDEDNLWNRGYCADSDNIYSLDAYYEMENDSVSDSYHFLSILNGVTREITRIIYRDENISYLTQPFVIGGRVFSTSDERDEDGMVNDYFVVELHSDGTLSRMINISSIAAERKMLPRAFFASECKLYYEPASERFYLISPEEDRMVVIDSEGNELQNLAEGGKRMTLQILAATEEGKFIFLQSEEGQATIFFYDGDDKKVLFAGKDGPERGEGILTVDGHGNLLFAQNGKNVVCWNIQTGEQEKLYIENAVENKFRPINCLMRNENGELLVLKDNKLRIVTEKGPAKQITISIKPFQYYNNLLTSCLTQYELTHPGVTFDLLETSEWDNRDRDIVELMNEISEGKGADLLILNREYMLALDRNDCLMDLSDLLRESTANNLIPGVFDYGRAKDGKIKMLSCNPDLQTVFVNQKYLNNSTWTVKDLVAVIEEREAQGNPFQSIIDGLYHPFLIFTRSIYDSEFMDIENGTCDFNNDLFVKVLEISKRYCNENSNYSSGESYKRLKQDEVLMYTPMTTANIKNYSEACAALGEEFVTAGYPSVSGNGNHMDFSMGYAINKNSENYEVIADFINWMFSAECVEMLFEVPARTDSFDGRVFSPTKNSYFETPYIRVDSKNILIDGKPDGTSYVDEYVQLIQNSRYNAYNAGMSEVSSILWEEAEYFFEGNKSAKEVASVIQSRVSLYLMENN